MTEQRLQEIERDNARIECPDCGGMGKFGPIDEDMDEDKCEACDGTGNCSRFPATGELIAEVRRLQEQATLTGAALLDIRHQREAERDAVEAWQQERDAALAERDDARAALDGWVKWASSSRCIYCGQEFVHDPHDQEGADEPKKAHVLTCAKHPMAQTQAALTEARRVLRDIDTTWALHGISPELQSRIAAVLAQDTDA